MSRSMGFSAELDIGLVIERGVRHGESGIIFLLWMSLYIRGKI
jgi:hypothetical protein